MFMNEKLGNILKHVRKYTSPTFLVLLGFSFLLWLLINLGHTYIANVTIPVNIGDTRIKVRCEAEGTGYRILAHRILRHSDIRVSLRDIETFPSITDESKLIVSPSSLKSVVEAHTKDLRIIMLTDIPEIPSPITTAQ